MLRLKVRLTQGAGKLVGCEDPATTSLEDLQSEIATKLNASFPGTLYLMDGGEGRYEVDDLCLLDDWQELLYVPNNCTPNNVKIDEEVATESVTIKREAEANNEDEDVESRAATKSKKNHKKGSSSREASLSDSEEANEFDEEVLDDYSDESEDENEDEDYEEVEEVATVTKVCKKKSPKRSTTPTQIGGKYFAKDRGAFYPITVNHILGNKVAVTWHGYNKCKKQVHFDDIVPWSRNLESTFQQMRSDAMARYQQKKRAAAARAENSKKQKMQQRLEERRRQQQAINDEPWGPKLRTNDLKDCIAGSEGTSCKDEANHRRIYFCQADETVDDIAKRFGVPAGKILYDNSDHLKGLTKKAKLYSKSPLVLPLELFVVKNYTHGKVGLTTQTAPKGKGRVLHSATSQKFCKACYGTDHQRSNSRLCPMNKKFNVGRFGTLDKSNEEATNGVDAYEQISQESQEIAALQGDTSERNTKRKRLPNVVSEVEEVTWPRMTSFAKFNQQGMSEALRGSLSVEQVQESSTTTSIGEEKTNNQAEGQVIKMEQTSVAKEAWYDCSSENHGDDEESNLASVPDTVGSS